MKEKIQQLCEKYHLGTLATEPITITGGLMHKMYRVATDKGEYAIKVLNPDIMKRPEALQNMINSEIVSNQLKAIIPLVAARSFDGKNIIEQDGFYYMLFDWLEGRSIFAPDITVYHCEQIGRILGKIHSADIEVSSMKNDIAGREPFDWQMLLNNALQQQSECYPILQENLADIMRWDEGAVASEKELAHNRVISHRDLDPKNVMWQDKQPYIIDWEAAGFVNPYQELVEVLNYWITDESGIYNRDKFMVLIEAYSENMNIQGVNWDAVLNASFDGMLGWLEYSVKRALGLEGSGTENQQEGMQQTIGTIHELKKYETQMEQIKTWINALVGLSR